MASSAEKPLVPESAAAPAGAASTSKSHLDQLDGLRTLATTWIVLGHFVETYPEGRGIFTGFLRRAHVGVGYYIVLSGFVTHYAYHTRDFTSCRAVLRFFRSRLGRIMFSYYFAYALGVLQRVLVMHSPLTALPTILSALMLDAWWPSLRLQMPGPGPNPGGWTISTLVFCWLVYPLIAVLFKRWMSGSFRILLLCAACCYAAAVAPSIAMFALRVDNLPGDRISETEALFLYQFPPARIAEFVLGMATSELVRMPGVNAWGCWPVVGWLALLSLVSLCLFVPYHGNGRTDYEALFISCPALLWCIVIAACACPKTVLAKHAALVSLGTYSFAAYLFQWLFFYTLYDLQSYGCSGIWGDVAGGNATGNSTGNGTTANGAFPMHAIQGLDATYMTALLFALWTSAGTFTVLVELPFVKLLRDSFGCTALLETTTRVVPALLVGLGLVCLPMISANCEGVNTSTEPAPLFVGSTTHQSKLQAYALRGVSLAGSTASAGAAWSLPQCAWQNDTSPAALAHLMSHVWSDVGAAKFVGARFDDHGIWGRTGRWAPAEGGDGLTADWATGRVSFRVTGATKLALAVHAACHTSDASNSVECGWYYASAVPDLGGGSVANWARVKPDAVDVTLNHAYAGTIVAQDVCASNPTRPNEHVVHELTGLDPQVEYSISLDRRIGPKSGGSTVRGLVLPAGATLLTAPEPAYGSAIVNIGASTSVGMGVLCTTGDYAMYPSSAVSHARFSAAAIVAEWQGAEYAVLADGSMGFSTPTRTDFTSRNGFDAGWSPGASQHRTSWSSANDTQWYRRALAANGPPAYLHDFEAEEARRPTRLVVVDSGDHDTHFWLSLFEATAMPDGVIMAHGVIVTGGTASITDAVVSTPEPKSMQRAKALRSVYVMMKSELIATILDVHPVANVVLIDQVDDIEDRVFENSLCSRLGCPFGLKAAGKVDGRTLDREVHDVICRTRAAFDCNRTQIVAFRDGPGYAPFRYLGEEHTPPGSITRQYEHNRCAAHPDAAAHMSFVESGHADYMAHSVRHPDWWQSGYPLAGSVVDLVDSFAHPTTMEYNDTSGQATSLFSTSSFVGPSSKSGEGVRTQRRRLVKRSALHTVLGPAR